MLGGGVGEHAAQPARGADQRRRLAPDDLQVVRSRAAPPWPSCRPRGSVRRTGSRSCAPAAGRPRCPARSRSRRPGRTGSRRSGWRRCCPSACSRWARRGGRRPRRSRRRGRAWPGAPARSTTDARDQARVGRVAEVAGQQHQHRPEALAAGGDQVARTSRTAGRRTRPRTDFSSASSTWSRRPRTSASSVASGGSSPGITRRLTCPSLTTSARRRLARCMSGDQAGEDAEARER